MTCTAFKAADVQSLSGQVGSIPTRLRHEVFEQLLSRLSQRSIRAQARGRTGPRFSSPWLSSRSVDGPLWSTYGSQAKKFWHYWRAFFMSCEELWAFGEGREWIVSHYRLKAA